MMAAGTAHDGAREHSTVTRSDQAELRRDNRPNGPPIKILSHRMVTSPSEVPEIYTRVGFRLENEHPPRTPELAPRDRLGSERPVPCPARAPRSARGRSRRCPCAENHRTEGMGRATPPRPASGRPVGDPRQLRLRVVPPEVRRDELAAARPRRPGPHKKDAAGRQ